MNERDIWVYGPVGLNLVWLLLTFTVGALTSFPSDAIGCSLVALLTSLVAIVGIFGFVVHDIGPAKTFAVMLAQTIILIAVYALIYLYRLHLPGLTFGDATYYSVLTWTSLGYADLVPKAEMRLVTASQAITGYVYLGLLVSVLAGAVSRPRQG